MSRQRYWGCPIPIAYNSKGEIRKIPLNNLPVKLPKNINLNVQKEIQNIKNEWRKIKINGENLF